MPQERHAVERVQRQMIGLAHDRFEVVEFVGYVLVRQDQPDDVDEGAARKAVDDRIGHPFSPFFDFLSAPERLGGFAQRLLARQAEIAKQMRVIGDLAQRDALKRPVEQAPPSGPAGAWRRS